MVVFVLVLIFIMLTAGVFGGLINFYLLNQNIKDTNNMIRNLVVGIGAAFLVPVALELLGSSLITLSQSDPGQLLIFTGICLIAALASRLVVTNKLDRSVTTSETAINEVNKLRTSLKNLETAVLPLIETETEIEQQDLEQPEALDSLDVAATLVLNTLAKGRYIFRTEESLLKEIDLPENDLVKSLNILTSKGLAGRTQSNWGQRWHLTERGRRLSELSI